MTARLSPLVLYIAGYGRSGSTLLDLALSNVEGVFGAGELANLFSEARTRRSCSCGVAVAACPVWREVLQRTGEAPSAQDAAIWRTVFDEVAIATDSTVVVDSSKTTRRTARRPAVLRKSGLRVVGVHLVRNPAAVLTSVWKGRDRELAVGSTRSPLVRGANVLRAGPSWWLANRAAERASATDFERSIMVHYEQFIDDPPETTRRILSLLGPDFEPPDFGALAVGHGIAGNRARRAGGASIRIAPVPEPAGRLSTVLIPLGRRYGYGGTTSSSLPEGSAR